ncbi:hypothetical protein SAMN05216296_2242 [Pseudomonas pohangensis]|uniref:SMP-30/Gluconolaconase/LRE-like region-containing protein n=1 Tax=Pseudomonas pohangensis TaxID=364197 RepID=A0A1H2GEU2_9PSED|nr:hypothetical protein [Pseudomonas pohangensis]SDU18034.1 hypothetical protein SAMN05216296_2242 [Pseudomonas pohangensis]
MSRQLQVLASASLLLTLSACSDTTTPIDDCVAKDGMQPICQFHNPEDIVLLADAQTLLISQMGRDFREANRGSLVFFDTRTQTLTQAFPNDSKAAPAEDNWGATDCPGNPVQTLAPHGIALRQRDDQRWQLAVVNHGGRESIEMFELLSDDQGPRLDWRGCVVAPDRVFVNDVALLKNGGFIASNMYDKQAPELFGINSAMLKGILGMDTGYVFEWQPASGFRTLAESHGAYVNGVEISPDEQTVFANLYFGDEVRKLDRISGKKLGSAAVSHADNLAWDAQGMLLVAAHNGSLSELSACFDKPGATCSLPFSIIRIDPQSMHSEVILEHGGAPMGAATVARQVGGDLYLGSFTGDRIVRLKYPAPANP